MFDKTATIMVYDDIMGLLHPSKDQKQPDNLLQHFIDTFQPVVFSNSRALLMNLIISHDQKFILLLSYIPIS